MEREIKISIIIPIYNAEKYLKRCLESIITQSLKEIEIICVNDGSTDNSLEILEKFQENNDRIIIINKKNSGASSARNTALKIVKGKYCLNIDSDDWIEQGYLEDLYNKAEKDNLDITITNIIFDFKDSNKKNYIINDLKIEDSKVISGKEYVKKFFIENSYGYTWNKLIKRELYTKNNLWYDEEIFLLEDLEILMQLSYYAERIGKLNKAYYHYIQGENNGSQKFRVERLKDIIIGMNKLINFYTKRDEKEIVKLMKQNKYLHLMSRILEGDYSVEKKKYDEILISIINEIKNEKSIFFKNIVSKNKYEKFLLFIIKEIKKRNIKIAILIIEIAKKIVFFRKKYRMS